MMNVSPWKTLLTDEYQVWGYPRQEAEENANTVFDGLQDSESVKAALRQAIEDLSGGENTVLFDVQGTPSVMVRVPTLRVCDLLDNSFDVSPHPAFYLGGRVLPEIFVGKYLTGMWQGRAASLPMTAPMRYHYFEQAMADCSAKGTGWLLMPFQLRVALALTSLQNKTLPRGNNEKGHDYFRKDECGVLCGEYTVLTGSGPVSWSHNGKASGIWDMNGNLNEWDTGLRLINGEIQLMETDSLIKAAAGQNSERLWRAMDETGRLVAPGTPGTLRYEVYNGGVRLTTECGGDGVGNCAFERIALKQGLKPVDAMRLFGLYPPASHEDAFLGWRWISTEGEVLPLCGGAYMAVDHASAFFAGITKPRNLDYSLAGMRFIYIQPQD